MLHHIDDDEYAIMGLEDAAFLFCWLMGYMLRFSAARHDAAAGTR